MSKSVANTNIADWLEHIRLEGGSHGVETGKGCLLEWTSRAAGEEWTDHPVCVSPVIAAFGRAWNDGLAEASDTATLERLKRYIPRLIGTMGTPEQEDRRAWMATDWLSRVHAPAFLRLAGMETFAVALEVCNPLTSDETAESAQPALSAARSAALSAAWSAAELAAWSTALSAARSAARSAAESAARSAALSAAHEALASTVTQLQESAFALLDEMIAVTATAEPMEAEE